MPYYENEGSGSFGTFIKGICFLLVILIIGIVVVNYILLVLIGGLTPAEFFGSFYKINFKSVVDWFLSLGNKFGF